MRNIFFVLILISIACNVQKNSDQIPCVSISVSRAEALPLVDILDVVQVVYLSLPDSVLVGDIITVKKNGDYLFLSSDYGSQSLVCFRKHEFLYHLDRLGGGPGEYLSLYAFYPDLSMKRLVVYDRSQQKVIYYDIDTGAFLEEFKVGMFLSNLEEVDEHTILYSSDLIDDEGAGYLFLANKSFKNVRTLLNTSYPLVSEAVFPHSFTRMGDGIFFAEPFTERIFRIDAAGITSVCKIDFGEQAYSLESSKNKLIEEIEAEISEKKSAFGVKFFVASDNIYSFFFNVGLTSYAVRVDRRNFSYKLFSNVAEDIDDGSIPFPMAVFNNLYAGIFSVDAIATEDEGYWSTVLDKARLTSSDYVMLYYRFKDFL